MCAGGERGDEGQGGQARPCRRAGLRAVRRRHLHDLLRTRIPRLREEHRQEPCGQSQGSARCMLSTGYGFAVLFAHVA